MLTLFLNYLIEENHDARFHNVYGWLFEGVGAVNDVVKQKFNWVPSDWNLTQLKDIVTEARLGGNYSNSESGKGVPLIKMGNLGRGRISLNKVEYVPDEEIVADDDMLQTGDLLFNTRNTLDLVGKVAIWQDELPKAAYNSNLLRYKFNKMNVSSNYFMNYLFNFHYALSQLRGFAIGTTSVAAIYGRDMKRFYVALPPLAEQEKIAGILCKWDEGVEKLENLISAKKKLKKALCQQLLTGKKRFKEFKGQKWKSYKASELFGSFTKKNNEDKELLSATQERGVIPRRLLEGKVMSPEGSTDGYKLVEPGDFVISLRSFQGGLEYSEYCGIVSPAYTVLKPSKEIDDSFYKHYFKSYQFIGHLAVAVIGIRDGKQISYDDFGFLNLPYPPLPEQQKIASVLNSADKEIELLSDKLEALKNQKKGLMQKLLTGKIRVEV